MANPNMKALLERLDTFCSKSFEAAAGSCVSRSNYEVSVEHVTQVFIDEQSADVSCILNHYDVDRGRLSKAIQSSIEKFKTGNSGRPVFSPILIDWIEAAWVLSSLDFELAQVRSGCLLIALLENANRFGGEWVDLLLEKIDVGDLKKSYATIIIDSKEEANFSKSGSGPAEGGRSVPGGESFLEKYCNNFTAKAREGKIDPVFGRDPEIRLMVDILARRRKNNPICVGEPGVGKTAVVEGLALRVTEGDVPDILKEVDIIGLDLALLQAGASIKGEFEKRLQGVIDEVKSSPKPIILFIDEAHTLIGAGGGAGTGDAANLLKPALARGELRTVAATTWSEYKKYFEKDPALARRFQVVKLEEPDIATTTTMLRGLRHTYEKAHDVLIRDDALIAAAEMGTRYITGRQNPDKGIDLVDTAAARVKVALATKPPALQDMERRVQDLERAKGGMDRDRETGGDIDSDRYQEIETELTQLATDIVTSTEKWTTERQAAQKIIDLRKELFADDVSAEDKSRLEAEIETARKELAEIQGDEGTVFIEVTPDVVGHVIADWTGIPVGNMVRDEASVLLNFEDNMKDRIMGQDHVLEKLGTGIRSAKSGLTAENQPMGIFLFAGPSGVGKTETATAVADMMFGGEEFMTSIAMSEFQEKHSVSRLVGTSAGYVGYGEGGQLTEAVRKRPYSVVLLDEVEKADLEVMNLFYQVFDKGTLNDGEGREIDFKNTIMFLTSNLATDIITQACADGRPDCDELVELIRPALSAHFKPALLARMTIIPFYTLDTDTLKKVTRLKLGRLGKRLMTSQKITLSYDDAVVDAIAARCTEVETGGRNVDHIINGTLLPEVSQQILQKMSEDIVISALTIGYNGSAFTYDFTEG